MVQKDQNTTIEETRRNLASTFQNANADINRTHFFNNNEEVNMYITNHTSNVNVHKVWVDSNNKPTTNGSNDIKVQLYKTTKKKETCNVTITIINSWGNDTKQVTASKNKPLNIELFEYGTRQNLDDLRNNLNVEKNGNVIENLNVYSKDSNTYVDIQTDDIVEDSEIVISASNNMYVPLTKVEVSYDEPDVSTTKTKVGEEVTLNAENSWSYTWSGDDLKANVTDGEDYYYTVEEVGVPSGYQVSYTNNDGIQEGDITVTNKKLDNYDLPDTGGFGTFGYYAIGALFITATLFAYIANIKKKGAYN